ncbi:MAG: efflux RND transporter periplasmic adaptor subunit [Phycisphaerae bacterium]
MDSTQSDAAHAIDTPRTRADPACPTMTPDPTPRQGRRNRITLILGLILIVATTVAAIFAKRLADERALLTQQEAEPAPIKVEVCDVTRQQVPIQLHVRGFLRGFRESGVYAEVAGRVVERLVADGDAVEAGQVLCRVDDTFYRLSVERARAALQSKQAESDKNRAGVAMAAAQVEVAQAERKQAQIEFDRIKRLFEEQTSPEIEYDRAETELQRASAAAVRTEAGLRWATHQLRATGSAVTQARAALDEATETLERCAIRSATAGRVDRMLIEEGEYVSAGQPIANLVQLDRLKLDVEFDAGELKLLRDDPLVQVVADGDPDRHYPATVHHIAPRADPVSRKFSVELHLDNPDGTLLAGMLAQARFSTASNDQILVLPSEAVVRRFGQDYCHVAALDGERHRAGLRAIQIRPVPRHRDVVQVVGGLAVGEQVVVDAQGELHDGSAVTIVANRTASLPARAGLPNGSGMSQHQSGRGTTSFLEPES